MAEVALDMKSRKEIKNLFDIQGLKIKDLMEIQPYMKVFVASTTDTLKGIEGFHSLDTEEFKTDENREKTKQAFLNACENWIDKNPVQKTGDAIGERIQPLRRGNLIQQL